MHELHFDFAGRGLTDEERLLAVMTDPAVLAARVTWPEPTTVTKPWRHTRDALFLFAVASVIFGGDRAAARQLRQVWPWLRRQLRRAGTGLQLGPDAPGPEHWRHYRSTWLDPDTVAGFHEALCDGWCGTAVRLGFFPEPTSG